MPEYNHYGRTPNRNPGSRPAHNSQHSRPAGSRPPQGRRPAPRRRKKAQPRLFLILLILVIIAVAIAVVVMGGGRKDPVVQPQATPAPAANSSVPGNVTMSSQNNPVPAASPAAMNYSTLSQWLSSEDTSVTALAAEDKVQVSDLSITPGLPSEWTNILLLGTDERNLNEDTRTDSMIICSINPSTGAVKLSSIMRDTAVHFDDIGDYSGTYRINSANFFGGPEYAVKTVNECFGMNIQYYVTVNFFGFQKIAQALGGVEMDITEAEMNEINKNAVDQAWIAYHAGIDESDQINEYLETYGPNTHLNGRQTLAYARIRSVDSDFSRADRQRQVLVKLMNKVKGKSIADIIVLAGSLSSSIKTNMDLNAILEIALRVVESGISDVETLRLPVNGTYKQERRHEQEMFYDCDFTTNARELYNFIYE